MICKDCENQYTGLKRGCGSSLDGGEIVQVLGKCKLVHDFGDDLWIEDENNPPDWCPLMKKGEVMKSITMEEWKEFVFANADFPIRLRALAWVLSIYYHYAYIGRTFLTDFDIQNYWDKIPMDTFEYTIYAPFKEWLMNHKVIPEWCYPNGKEKQDG